MEQIQNTEVEAAMEEFKQKQSEEVEHHDEQQKQGQEEEDEEELRKLLLSDIGVLPHSPPSATQVNFVSYFITDFTKPGHDQYIYRHANGLCVIGLAPTHIAFKDEGGIINIDFNVGKSDRSVLKVSGKRKKNAMRSEPNTALCKVSTANDSYVVRCCVKGSLLEVNERLIKQPQLLNSSADREGYIAIIMPRPADWTKNKESLITLEEYKEKKQVSLDEIIMAVEKLINAKREEEWFSEHTKCGNLFSMLSEDEKIIEHATNAETIVRKILSMIVSLIGMVESWETERETPFMYDKHQLLHLLNEEKKKL